MYIHKKTPQPGKSVPDVIERPYAAIEIGNAVRAVETNYQRALAYRTARELAEQKLTAEEEKFKVGLSTNYLVLQYQRDLANAQTMELKALIDYNISLASLDRVMGAGRDRQQVSVLNMD